MLSCVYKKYTAGLYFVGTIERKLWSYLILHIAINRDWECLISTLVSREPHNSTRLKHTTARNKNSMPKDSMKRQSRSLDTLNGTSRTWHGYKDVDFDQDLPDNKERV
jgi:hypothetical protein